MLAPHWEGYKNMASALKNVDCQANHNNEFLHWSAAVNLEALLFPRHLPFLPPLKQQLRNQPRHMFRVAYSFSLNGQKYFSRPFSFPCKSFQCILDRTDTIASALLFYRWHLDKAGGRHVSTGYFWVQSVLSKGQFVWVGVAPWWETRQVRTKAAAAGSRRHRDHPVVVLGGTAREASEKPVCPSKAVPRRVLTDHALSYSSSREWNHRGGIPCAECLLSLNGTNSERVCPSD